MQLLQSSSTTKSLLLVLFWKFSITFVFNSFFNSSVYLLYFNDDLTVIIEVIIAVTFLCISPLASFVADVKVGRLKTLLSSTYFILTSYTVFIIGICGIFFAVHSFNYLFYIFLALCSLEQINFEMLPQDIQ